jgi:hypothetical protein
MYITLTVKAKLYDLDKQSAHSIQSIAKNESVSTAILLRKIYDAKIVEDEMKYSKIVVRSSSWKGDTQTLVLEQDSVKNITDVVYFLHDGAGDGYLEGKNAMLHIPGSSNKQYDIVFDDIVVKYPNYWVPRKRNKPSSQAIQTKKNVFNKA